MVVYRYNYYRVGDVVKPVIRFNGPTGITNNDSEKEKLKYLYASKHIALTPEGVLFLFLVIWFYLVCLSCLFVCLSVFGCFCLSVCLFVCLFVLLVSRFSHSES